MLLLKTADHATFVHVADPHCDPLASERGPAEGWHTADGQAPDATRVTVRPLTIHELVAARQAESQADQTTAALKGLVSIDGEAADADQLSGVFATMVAGLVLGVTGAPFPGLNFGLGADASTGATSAAAQSAGSSEP